MEEEIIANKSYEELYHMREKAITRLEELYDEKQRFYQRYLLFDKQIAEKQAEIEVLDKAMHHKLMLDRKVGRKVNKLYRKVMAVLKG